MLTFPSGLFKFGTEKSPKNLLSDFEFSENRRS